MNLSIAKLEYVVSRRITHPPRVELMRAGASIVLTFCVASAAYAMHLNLASAVSVLLLTAVIASIEWGVVQGSAVSLTAVGCLDFLFTQPLFSFSVHSRENWIALSTFEITALLVSRLSWKERLHAQEQEYQRQGISKLYQLSNAILLVDRRSSDLEQLGTLMREFFAIESVDLWIVPEGRSSQSIDQAGASSNSAYRVFVDGRDVDSVEGRWSHRVLRLGASPLGGMILQGWEVDPALADAAGSLIAVAVERVRSAQKENRAEAARNTEQLRAAVLDALAHGFKTPLTAIQTASSGLLAIGRLGKSQTELVEIIDQEVGMLANLTTRLLRTAALDAREIRVRSSMLSIMDIIESAVTEQSIETRHRIQIARPAWLEDVHADGQLLALAFAQLIDNASKYSFAGTPIELAVEQDGATTSVTVRNQGDPICDEDLSRIFERFYRGSQAGRGPTGTGLGLSIVKKIAEAHGGDALASCQGNQINISISVVRSNRLFNG